MNVDSIKNGIVIDHITAGKGMKLYNLLGLDALDCPVAIIKNVSSNRMGKKDIIKVDGNININYDVIGFVDSGATVNVIKDSEIIKKETVSLPEILMDAVRCKNPRCITSAEPGLRSVFKLTDRENKIYRCIYCETKIN